MTLFAIIQQPGSNSENLGNAVGQAYPESVYNLGNGVWLVSDVATASTVSDKLGVTEGENGSAIVVEIASYFGRANPAIWTWIKSNWDRPTGG